MDYNIHFFIDSTYTQEIISFINTHFGSERNLHIITESSHNLKFVKPKNYPNIHVVNKIKFKEIKKVKNAISKIDEENIRCFYHYLSNDSIVITKLIGLSKKEHNWILWGADLYEYIDYSLYSIETKNVIKQNRKTSDLLFSEPLKKVYYKCIMAVRKNFLKSLDRIITWNRGDYKLACEHFKITPMHVDYLYNLGLKKESSLLIKKETKEKMILVGNSGDPSNNHIDIYKALEKLEGDFKVLSFLTYGDPNYIKKIIRIGHEIFGNKFMPITDHMTREDYFKFIEDIDVVIMNHYRQQGVGNIVSFLQKGKKVYINDFVTTYEYLVANNIVVFPIGEIMNNPTMDELIKYDSDIQRENSELIYELFSDEAALQKWTKVLN